MKLLEKVYTDDYITINKIGDGRFNISATEISEQRGGFLEVCDITFHPEIENDMLEYLTTKTSNLWKLLSAMRTKVEDKDD